MRITVYSIAGKMPKWVDEAVSEYQKRLKAYATVKWVELPMAKRGKTGHAEQWREIEAQTLRSRIPEHSFRLLLDVKGHSYSTTAFAEQLAQIQQIPQDIAIIIGGPDGVDDQYKRECQQMMALSELTFPHPLVRVILAEQLYRALSWLAGHPYHRDG